MPRPLTPAQRARLERVKRLERVSDRAAERAQQFRQQTLRDLNAEGLSLRTLAAELGVTFARVHQLINGR